MSLQDRLRSVDDQSVSECAEPAGSIAMKQLVSACHEAAAKIDALEANLRDIAIIVDKQDCFAVEGVLSLSHRHKEACKQIVELMRERDNAIRARDNERMSTGPVMYLSYSLHDKVVKLLEDKLHNAHLEIERARAERDEAKSNRKYAPPMIVRFNHQLWEDGEYVVTVDGDPVGGSVSSPDGAKAIARWMGTAWAELIEHNTMKHRSGQNTQSGLDSLGNAVIQ